MALKDFLHFWGGGKWAPVQKFNVHPSYKIFSFYNLLIKPFFTNLKIQKIYMKFSSKFKQTFNDNLMGVLLAGPAVLPVLPLAKFNFDILVLRKEPYCILLHSVMPVDAAQKKDEIRLILS